MASADCTLLAQSYGHPESELLARVTTFDAGTRIRRAAGVAGLLLVGALVSLPVPGWHFIGVPGCLVGAVWLARARLREHRRVDHAEGPCPACHAALSLTPGGDLPWTQPCPACGEFLKLTDVR